MRKNTHVEDCEYCPLYEIRCKRYGRPTPHQEVNGSQQFFRDYWPISLLLGGITIVIALLCS